MKPLSQRPVWVAAFLCLGAAVDKLLRLVIQLQDEASGQLEKLQGTMGALQVAAGNLLSSAIQSAGQAILGLGASSIKVAGDFEAGMNTFAAAAGDSLAAAGLSVNDFRDKFIQIGAQLPVSTSAVQEAATSLIKGGLDPMVVKMGGLEASIKFAAAAGMDLNAAAELSIKNLGTFVPITASAAEQTQFLASSQDLLVKAAGASTLDVDKLGAAMLAAGGQAKASGVDYQDFVSTMGLISPSFDSAATAGTSYKNFLARLQPTTTAATDAFQKLGLMTFDTSKALATLGVSEGRSPEETMANIKFAMQDLIKEQTGAAIGTKEFNKAWDELNSQFVVSKFYDATGAFVGNREAAELLKNSLTDLSDAERVAALQAMFGNDAMGAAVALANSGAAGYDKFAAAMANASGVEQTAKTIQQGFNIALDNMHGSIEALQIVVGTALLPVLTYLLNTVISPGINLVTQFAQAMVGGGDALAGLPPILQSVVGFFESLWNAEGAVEAAFISAGTNSLAFGVALDQLGTALGLPLGLLSGISYAIQDFIAMVYPAADAIGAFVLGLGNLGTVSATLTTLFGATIGGLITQAIAVLNNYATAWIDLGMTIFNAIAALLSGDLAGAWSALTSGIAQVVLDYQTYALSFTQLIGSIAQSIITAIVTYAPMIAAQVLTWGAAFVDWISPYAALALTTLNTWLAGLWTWVQLQAPGWLAQLGTWGMALVDWATPYLSLALTTLSAWVGGLWAWVQQQAPGWLTTLGSWGQVLVDWATPYLSLALTTLSAWVGGLWAWVQQQAPGWLTTLGSWGAQLAAWIGPAIPPALAALGELANSAFAWVSSQAATLLASFSSWATSLVEWIPGATVSFLAAWPGMLNSFLDWIASAAGPLLAQLGMWAVQFTTWIVPMIPSFLVGLAGVAAALATWIIETAVIIAAKVLVWAGSLLGWIAKEVLPKLPGMLDGVKASILSWITAAAIALANAALDLGRNIIDGIKKGITAGVGALTDAVKSAAKSALDAAKSLLQINSPSKVFANEVGIGIPEGIALGITNGAPAMTTKLLSSISDMASKAAKALEDGTKAIAAASTYSGAGGSGISGFLTDFAQLAIMFDAVGTALGAQLLNSATKFAETVGKVGGALTPAIEGMQALDGFVQPAQWSINNFGAGLISVVLMLVAATSSFEVKSLDAAIKLTESIAKLLGIIEPGVKAFDALNNYTKPVDGQVKAFTGKLWWLVQQFVEAGQWLRGEGLAGAVTLAEGAYKILAVVSVGVEAFKDLNTYTKPIDGQVTAFTGKLNWLILQFVQAGAWLRGAGLAGAVALADAASKILSVISTGVEAFAALNTYVKPVDGSIAAFTGKIAWLVQQFVQAGNWLRGPALAAGVAFAEGAGKIVALIKPAVDGFAALPDLVAPTNASTQAFADALLKLVGQLWFAARQLDAEGVAATATFAEAASKIVALIKPAVDGFAALPGLVAPTWDSTKAFADALLKVVGQLWLTARGLDVDAVAAAAAFAESAGKVIAILKNGVEGLNALRDLAPVAYAQVVIFGNALDSVVWMLYMVADDVGQKATDAAAKFADGAGKVIAILKNGVDGLNALADLAPVAYAQVVLFGNGLDAVVWMLYMVADDVSQSATDAAAKFAEGAGKVIAILKNGVDGLNALGDLHQASDTAIQSFVAMVNRLMIDIGAAASQFSLDAIAAAGKFADAAGKAVGILKTGVEGLLNVSTFTGVSEAAITRFADGVRLAVAAMARLATEFGAEATASAKAFAQAAGESTDFLKKGVDGFGKLAEMKDVPLAGLKLFEAAILQLLQTMIRLSAAISVQMLTDATRIANAIDSVITVLSNSLKALVTLGNSTVAMPGIIDAFTTAVKTLGAKLGAATVAPAGDIGAGVITAIGTGMLSAIPQAVGQLTSLQAQLLTVLVALRLAVAAPSLTIGQQISYGIAQGITTSTPAIVNAVYAAVAAALAAARAALGIASPSTVFDEDIGQMGGAGMAQGFDRSVPVIADAAGRMAGAAVAPAQAALRPVAAGAGGGGGSTSPAGNTITIQSGAITIQQQPGEDSEALANRLLKILESKYGLRSP